MKMIVKSPSIGVLAGKIVDTAQGNMQREAGEIIAFKDTTLEYQEEGYWIMKGHNEEGKRILAIIDPQYPNGRLKDEDTIKQTLERRILS